LNFNEKYEKTNYSTACGLAIFSNFYLYWFFSNIPFFERDPHMDSPEAMWVKTSASPQKYTKAKILPNKK
jgi:hypothetical protein